MGPVPYAGTIAEPVEDFFTNFERYLINHAIPNDQAERYLPDFLAGMAREFFCTLTDEQRAEMQTIRTAFVQQFATNARRQAALQAFYQANQMSNESASQYYCRVKAAARAAFSDQNNDVRNQHVTARMKQGLRPELRRSLLGRAFASAEELRAAAEDVEIELNATKTETPLTRKDIEEVIKVMQNTAINGTHAIARANEDPPKVTYIGQGRRRLPPRIYYKESIATSKDCHYCGYRGHRAEDCRRKARDEYRKRQETDHETRGPKYNYNRYTGNRNSNSHRNANPQTTREVYPRHRVHYQDQDKGKKYINTMEVTNDNWPKSTNEETEHEARRTTQGGRKPSPLNWLFMITCILAIMGTAEAKDLKYAGKPMLCQTTTGQRLYQIPKLDECKFHVGRNQSGPANATIKVFKTNMIQYKMRAYVCTRVKKITRRLTYFAAVSHREETHTQYIRVQKTECQSWKATKLSKDGPLVYSNGVWTTQNYAKIYWPGVFQCCKWVTFAATNTMIAEGTVIKDHNHKMHSDLGHWSQCHYEKGHCTVRNGAQAIWYVNDTVNCKFIFFQNMTGQLWGNSFLTDDQTLALTFTNETINNECNKPKALDVTSRDCISDFGHERYIRWDNWTGRRQLQKTPQKAS